MTKYRGMPCEERYDRESKDGSDEVVRGEALHRRV